MPKISTKVDIWSNHPDLQMAFTGPAFTEQIEFVEYKSNSSHPYVIVLIDLTQDLSDISQKLIAIYDHCRSKSNKLAVVICHGEKIDGEKNLYFSQLLDGLGGDSPIHRLVLTKDLYQDLFEAGTWIEKVILDSLLNKKITISGKGNTKLYPLNLKDCVAALQKILFLSGTAGKTFWLVGDSITDLDLAYLLQKSLEDSEESFEIEATEANTQDIALDSLGNQSRAVLNWEPIEEFSFDLKNTVHRFNEDKSLLLSSLHREGNIIKHPRWFKITKIKNSLVKAISHLKTKKGSKQMVETSQQIFAKIMEVVIAIIVIVYLLVTITFIATTSIALVSLDKTLSSARAGSLSESVLALKKSSTYSRIGESSYRFVSPLFTFIAPDFHEKNHNLFVFLHYSQASLENLQQTYLLAEKIYQSIGNPNINLNYNDAGLALRSNLSQVFENISEIRLLTQSGKLPSVLEERLAANPEFKNISIIESQVTQLLKSIDLIPTFLAGERAKNIVFLFQNSQELRSTGGVIDYLLTLVLDKGQVISRNIYTSGEIDSLIAGSVTAPPLINLYTGSEIWKIRDLNYNPDYASTATNFAAVIDKSLKFKPDIVVAVNESLVQSFLNQEKGIVINGQSITSEIFQSDLAKNSPSTLYRQLIDHYLDQVIKHQLSLLTLSRVISEQSAENQMLFWTADETIEKSIANQSYSGGVYPHSCHPAISGKVFCLAQTGYFNESNFSLVPVGRSLQKKIIHKVSFTQTSIKHEYLIDYKFTKEFPNLNRDLNEIIQLYAPANSFIESVQINQKSLSLNTIQKQQDNLLERFQIPISLKFNRDNRLEIIIITPLTEKLHFPFAYSQTEYRQPGLRGGDSNVELIIVVPEGARAASITAAAVSSPDGYSYIFPSKTATFGIGFEPKVR